MLEYLLDEKLYRCSTRRIAIDIGANVGFFTTGLSTRFDHVHAFELNPSTRTALIANTKNTDNITVYNVGLSNNQRTVQFLEDSASGNVRIPHDDELEVLGPMDCENKVVPLDDYNLTQVDLIKIDVEGHEFEVLCGAKNTILANKPLIVCEIWNRRDLNFIPPRLRVIELMKSYGYEIVDCRLMDFVFRPH